MLVFAHTSPFRPGKSYSKAVSLALRRPSSNTLDLVATATRGMRTIFKAGYVFRSTRLVPATSVGVAMPVAIGAECAASGRAVEGMGVMEFMVSSPGVVRVQRS